MQTEGQTERRGFFKQRRNIVLVVLLILLIAVVAAPYIGGTQPKTKEQVALDSAMSYFTHSYDYTTGLIPETQGGSVFWLYSDNYLASLAMARYAGQNSTLSTFASAVHFVTNAYASTTPEGSILNQYTALNSTVTSFRCSTDYTLSWSSNGSALDKGRIIIKTTVNDGDPSCSTPQQNYADLLFLQAVYYRRLGNTTAALEFYNLGASDFDGIGIRDRPFTTQGSGSFNVYQTYKLALYTYSAVCLGQAKSDSNFPKLETILLSQQDNATGGFYTGYYANMQHASPTGNAETTALAALALELIANPSANC